MKFETKVRLGNRKYKQSELEEYSKANTKRYNSQVRRNRENQVYTAFYNSTVWRKTREQVLIRDNYLCQRCLAQGVITSDSLIVHHKVELKRDWSKRLDMDNLEVVCFSCHNKIHGQQKI